MINDFTMCVICSLQCQGKGLAVVRRLAWQGGTRAPTTPCKRVQPPPTPGDEDHHPTTRNGREMRVWQGVALGDMPRRRRGTPHHRLRLAIDAVTRMYPSFLPVSRGTLIRVRGLWLLITLLILLIWLLHRSLRVSHLMRYEPLICIETPRS